MWFSVCLWGRVWRVLGEPDANAWRLILGRGLVVVARRGPLWLALPGGAWERGGARNDRGPPVDYDWRLWFG